MPSWVYLVVLFFLGLLVWPALEGRFFRTLRRARRRLARRPVRVARSASRAVPVAPLETDSRVTPLKDPRRAA